MPFDGTPISDPAIELLEKVRHLLEEKEWVQDSYVGYDNYKNEIGYCLVGAMRHFQPSRDELEQAIIYLGFGDELSTYYWNDHDKRTKTGVLRRLTLRINKAKQSLLLKV